VDARLRDAEELDQLAARRKPQLKPRRAEAKRSERLDVQRLRT
jgi:hypothetical protein